MTKLPRFKAMNVQHTLVLSLVKGAPSPTRPMALRRSRSWLIRVMSRLETGDPLKKVTRSVKTFLVHYNVHTIIQQLVRQVSPSMGEVHVEISWELVDGCVDQIWVFKIA